MSFGEQTVNVRMNLHARMIIARETLRSLRLQIQQIETSTQTPTNEKVLEITKIQSEISKVGMEIDSIKKEITIMNSYRLN